MMKPSAAAGVSESAKYRGVRKRKWGKWVSEIRLPNSRERIWLGSYDSPEKAARAFDAALFCLRGNTANFNFPDQPPDIPGGTDLHPSQIQAVAAHFANSYPSHPGANSTSTDDVMESTSFLTEDHNNCYINNMNIPDFGIFPGFDDYFMPIHQPPPLTLDYGSEEVVYDGEPSFLWNF